MASGPAVGKTAPNVSLPATGDKTVSLRSLRGGWVVLYFYPKDSTSGCTREGEDFRDLHARFRRAGATILGISRDSLRSHERFRDKHGFPFDLLSDTDEAACSAYDVIRDKTMYGKKVRGIERSTFIIDPAGKLRQEWRKVRVEGHAEAVLESLKSLARG